MLNVHLDRSTFVPRRAEEGLNKASTNAHADQPDDERDIAASGSVAAAVGKSTIAVWTRALKPISLM